MSPAATRAGSAARAVDRVRASGAAFAAAALGAAPHVLHHVGQLAGAALLSGATGKLLFGALGFLLAVPMLRHLRRRYGSWTVPGGALALMAIVFTVSTVILGPALTGSSDESAVPAADVPGALSSPSDHESHHRDEGRAAP
jgi:hypothetical protein